MLISSDIRLIVIHCFFQHVLLKNIQIKGKEYAPDDEGCTERLGPADLESAAAATDAEIKRTQTNNNINNLVSLSAEP